MLEVLAAFRHPVWITTQGTLIERDIDLIGADGRAGAGCGWAISVTTLDAGLARKMEPRAPAPQRRLAGDPAADRGRHSGAGAWWRR